MSSTPYISAGKLPLNQDFRALKNLGIDQVRQINTTTWTNLNASDPGITILDQLCYALTELGYCNDFPITDILTNPNGQLEIEDQFYLPHEILTTAPITILDYQKCIIDDFDAVENVILQAIPSPDTHAKGIYAVFLSLAPTITNRVEIAKVCRAVYVGLNRRRNIGELFLMPQPFEALKVVLTGEIAIGNERDADRILTLIHNSIRAFVFPKTQHRDYNQLTNLGIPEDEIYNGPDLKNGFMSTNDLGRKNNTVHLRELVGIIQSVAGVRSVSRLRFEGIRESVVQSANHQVLVFSLDQLQITAVDAHSADAIAIEPVDLLAGYKELRAEEHFGASEKKARDLPLGQFRDINTYYSIQNTFPSLFAVGPNAISSGATDFQIAQSRQLKGYLTLFDQVLANQFSQLANVPRLFSFKNSFCGVPSEWERFNAHQDQFEKQHSAYPAAFQTFSPTYFYQPLYEIPGIRPLLKGNEAFLFGSESESRTLLEKRSWDAYRHDPYNRYIKGLMDFVEDETINTTRRNELLNHLLARHGESPLVVDALLDGSVYSGNDLKDRVIFKSLYLQNLDKLSYFRQKGYDCFEAQPISPLADPIKIAAESLKPATERTVDFIFNSNQIDRTEAIQTQDLANHAALELKLNLLFGLRMQYENYMATTTQSSDLAICLWMVLQRKGFILVENCLLHPSGTTVTVTQSVANGPYFEIKQSFGNLQIPGFSYLLQTSEKIRIDNRIFPANPTLAIDSDQFELRYSESQQTPSEWIVSGTPGIFFKFDPSKKNQSAVNAPMIELIFPDFIPQFKTVAFKDRLELFLTLSLPPEVTYRFQLMTREQLQQVIPAFTDWHNALLQTHFNFSDIKQAITRSNVLIELLYPTNTQNHV